MRKLFPHISEDQLEETAANLDAYIELAWEVFEDLKGELPEENPGEPKVHGKIGRKPVDSVRPPFDSSQG
jgi:hypothetical protein